MGYVVDLFFLYICILFIVNMNVQSVFEVLVELWFVGILFEEVGIFYHCLTLWHSYIQCNVMVQCNFFLAISSRCFRIDSLAAHKWAWIILTGGGFWHTDLLLFFRIIHHEFWPNQCFEALSNNVNYFLERFDKNLLAMLLSKLISY